MSDVRMLFEIDGVPVPVEMCDWLQTAPCGCPCALHVAGPDALTEDDAWRRMTGTETMREVERDRKQGFTMKLVRRDSLGDEWWAAFGKCPHEPKWGVAETPIPEGFTWAREGRRRAKTRHLVAAEAAGDWSKRRTALCGHVGKLGWKADDLIKYETMECSQCIRRAAKAKGTSS